jgi:hypothetical protein
VFGPTDGRHVSKVQNSSEAELSLVSVGDAVINVKPRYNCLDC